MKNTVFLSVVFSAILVGVLAGCGPSLTAISDKPIRTPEQWRAWKRSHPEPIRHLVCGGSGISRLLIYLDGTERLAAVEAVDGGPNAWTAPYRVAHPELQALPVWSNGHGRDQIEKLLSLEHPPQIILRLDMPGMGITPDELQRRTGIPTVLLPYGDLQAERETLFTALHFLGEILDKRERARAIIAFFEEEIADIQKRTADVPEESRPSVYVGGVSYRGAHGLNATTRNFPPLRWLGAENVANRLSSNGMESDDRPVHIPISREQLAAWSPDFLFVDMATLVLSSANAVEELRTVPLYRSLDAVENGRVYLLLPNASYNVNFGAQLANAWFMGAVLYPDRFGDIDPRRKAGEIFRFLTGASVLDEIERRMPGQVFRQIGIRERARE